VVCGLLADIDIDSGELGWPDLDALAGLAPLE
jgi:hypothetical protein